MNLDQINLLKWQILSRLPHGSIYERIKAGIQQDNLKPDNPFYYIYWLDLNRSDLKKYILGTFRTQNSDYVPFIEWLDRNYGNGSFYSIRTSFGTIQIPKPNYEDYKCFKAEFLDIVMPYLVSENRIQPFLEGPYESQNVVLKKGDIVLDLGANYGLFSSIALAKDCQVYAFEPTVEARKRYLERLQKQNSNMKVFKQAISNVVGEALFELHSVASCNQLQSTDLGNPTILVETTTIDAFAQKQNLDRIDFIKADIEGAERLMLEGARTTLKEFAPNLSICYYHKIDDLKILKKMIIEANPNYDIEVQYRKIYAKDRRKN